MWFFNKRSAEPGVSREMRTLIQRLTLGGSSSSSGIIAFIAARPREGTTTVARDFAVSLFMETAQKVLLIDAGTFQAKRFKSYGFDPEEGIIDAFIGKKPLASAVHSVNTGIWIGRWIADDANRGLAAKLTRDPELWEALAEEFQYIVIDAPPLQTTFDGVLLAAKADSVVIVVEAESTRQPVIENLRDTLIASGAPIAGMVMNKRRFYIPQRVYRKL